MSGMGGEMTYEEYDRLQERRDELAKEVFGHPGVGYGSMKPYVKVFINRMIRLENAVDAVLALAADMKRPGDGSAAISNAMRAMGGIIQTTVEDALKDD